MDRDDISNRDGCSCGRSIDAELKEALDMNEMLDPNKMAEATRLTRAGRLAEAVALLQRMLRAESPRDITFGTAVDIVPTGREPPIIDATAKSEETACPPSSCFGIESRPASRPFASSDV